MVAEKLDVDQQLASLREQLERERALSAERVQQAADRRTEQSRIQQLEERELELHRAHQTQLEQRRLEHESEVRRLMEEIAAQRTQLDALKRSSDDTQRQLTDKDSSDRANRATIAELRSQLETETKRSQVDRAYLQSSLDSAMKELESLRRSTADASNSLSDALGARDSELAQLKKTLAETTAALESQLSKSRSDAEAVQQRLQMDMDAERRRLQNEVASLQSQLQRQQSNESEAVSSLRKQLDIRDLELRDSLSKFTDLQRAQSSLQVDCDRLRVELTSEQRRAAEFETALAKCQSDLKSKREAFEQLLQSKVNDRTESDEKLSVLQSRFDAVEGKLAQCNSDLEACRNELTAERSLVAQLNAKLDVAHQELAELAAKHDGCGDTIRSLQLDVDRIKFEIEQRDQIFARQSESQDEQQRSHRALQEQLQQSKLRLDEERQQRQQAQERWSQEREELLKSLDSLKHQNHEDRLAHSRAIDSMKREFDSLRVEHSIALSSEKSKLDQLDRLHRAAESERNLWQTRHAELSERYSALESQYHKQLTDGESLKSVLADSDTRIHQIRADHERQIAEIIADRDSKLDAAAKHNEMIGAQLEQQRLQLSNLELEIQQLQQQLRASQEQSQSFELRLEQCTAEHQSVMEQLQQRFQSALDDRHRSDAAALQQLKSVESHRAALADELQRAQSQCQTLLHQITQLESEMDAAAVDARAQLSSTVQSLEQLWQSRLTEADREYRVRLDDVIKQHEKEHEVAQSERSELEARFVCVSVCFWGSVHRFLVRRVEEWRQRYEQRESRLEDVEKLKQLSTLLRQVEAARLQAVEELKMYKLELINREENYNKVFGAKPVVGTPALGATGAISASTSAFTPTSAMISPLASPLMSPKR